MVVLKVSWCGISPERHGGALDREDAALPLHLGFIIRLPPFSTAQPLYTRFPIIFSACFPKVAIGDCPSLHQRAGQRQLLPLREADEDAAAEGMIPHHETFSTTTQPPYSSTKG
jgi:hypothetical protein